MKKLLLSVFALAILITSCNKYANDFQALKDQIAALSLKVDGVTALQSQLTSTTAQITALQAAVAALPSASSISSLSTALGTANTNIAAIQTKLNDLATTGATAASVAALKAQLEGIIASQATADAATAASLAALQTKLDAAATSAEVATLRTDILDAIIASASTTDATVKGEIATLKADILAEIKAGNDGVTAKIAELKGIVDAANAANEASFASVIANLGTLTDAQAATQNSVVGLQLALAAAQRDLTILLNASAMYNDNVNISTDSDVDFYLAKLFQMGIINGNLIVNTDAITKIADLNKILSAVVAVIGTNDAVQVISAGNHHHGNTSWTLTTVAGSGHFVSIEDQVGSGLTATLLTSVRGDYTVSGNDISDPKIDNVGGTVTYDYAGDYESVSLKTVGVDLSLVAASGNINFPNLVVGHGINDNNGPVDGTVVFNAAGTLNINFGLATTPVIKSLTALNATNIVLGYETIEGLAIVAPKAEVIDLGTSTSSTSTINITTWAATAIHLDKLATSTGSVTINTANGPTFYNGTVDLSVFNSPVALTINGPETITLPALVAGTLSASQAQTVTLAVYEWLSSPSLPAVQTLTAMAVKHEVALGQYATLETADIDGAPAATFAALTAEVTSTGNPVLATISVGGSVKTVDVENLPLLTSLTTEAGSVVNTFRLDHAAIIEEVSLNHQAFVDPTNGGSGSVLIVTNNAKLASLAPTVLDWMAELEVTGNDKLASFDFSSYKTQLYAGASVSVIIDAMGAVGSYTAGVDAVGAGNPAMQAVIKSNDIMTLKSYLIATAANTHVTSKSFSINIGVNSPVVSLSTLMSAEQPFHFGYTNLVTGGPITTLDELSLVENM